MPYIVLRDAEFDELCLTPGRPLTPDEIRELREREGASQAVVRPIPSTSRRASSVNGNAARKTRRAHPSSCWRWGAARQERAEQGRLGGW
jgi:hypothetical protein